MYRIIKFFWSLGVSVFFRRIEVIGRENIPSKGGILFVSNHLNAFVDGILLMTLMDFPLRVTAKATLKKNPVFRFLLNSIHAVTLQRAEDGESQSGNIGALDEVDIALKNGERVLIFPEGFSHSEGILRPFKKGAARIAEKSADNSGPFFVIPVGLIYLEKDRFRSEVLVHIGKPITKNELLSLPNTESRSQLFRERMESLALPLPPRELREMTWLAKVFLASDSTPPRLGERRAPLLPLVEEIRQLHALKFSSDRDILQNLEGKARALHQSISLGGLRPDEIFLPIARWRAVVFGIRELEIFLIAVLPAFWGWIQAAPSYFLTKLLLGKTARDEDHVATHAIFLGLPIFAIFLVLQSLGIFVLFGKFWGLFYILTLPYFLSVAVFARDRFQECICRIRSFAFLLSRSKERDKVRAMVSDLRKAAKELRAVQP